MAAITRAHHMGLQVADLERSVAFYRDIARLRGHLRVEPPGGLHPRARRLPRGGHPRCGPAPAGHRRRARAARLPERGTNGGGHAARPTRAPPTSRSSSTTWTTLYAGPRDDQGVRSVSAAGHADDRARTRVAAAVYLIDPDGIRVELIETRRSFADYAAEQAADTPQEGAVDPVAEDGHSTAPAGRPACPAPMPGRSAGRPAGDRCRACSSPGPVIGDVAGRLRGGRHQGRAPARRRAADARLEEERRLAVVGVREPQQALRLDRLRQAGGRAARCASSPPAPTS
ncbi:MAG: VOC family protein [Candidatus Limnocylindrales bacterium]